MVMKNIFQVEFYEKINENLFSVDGRFIEGYIIKVGYIFSFLKDNGVIYNVNYIVLNILMYKRNMPFIGLGMTGRLVLQGNFSFSPKNSFEIIGANNALQIAL